MSKYKAKDFTVEASKCTLYEYNERYSSSKIQHTENKFVNGFDVCWCGYHFFVSEEKFYELYEEIDDLSSNKRS